MVEVEGPVDPDEAIGRTRLGGRLLATESLPELCSYARLLPQALADLFGQGLAPARVIGYHSAIIDTVVRRTLQLVFAEHPALSLDDFTWLALGSNGRREAVLSSDIDAAVVFLDTVTAPKIASYREVFASVSDALREAGLRVDRRGTTPANRTFARTEAGWRTLARHWLADPTVDNGAMMTSLLVDARPIHGDPGLPTVARVFAGLRDHPGTMRLLLKESLAKRPGMVWDLRGRRLFDVKTDALLPIVNLARWLALAGGSGKPTAVLPTHQRLVGVGGTTILPARRARALAASFEEVQGLRLRHQLAQVARGESPTSIIGPLSRAERHVISRAIHEVSVAQRRAANIAAYVPVEQWLLPD